MKTLRRAISAALSAAIAGTVLAANSASFCFTASAMTDTRFFSQFQFESSWYSLIQQEKQKFPETVNGQQCYWNGNNADSYTDAVQSQRRLQSDELHSDFSSLHAV